MEQFPVSPRNPVIIPHHHRSLVSSGVALVVLFLAITAGSLIFSNYWPQWDESIPASSTPDPRADWKTHTNRAYGFEFRYPSNEFLVNTSDGVDYGHTVLTSKTSEGQSGILIITSIKKSSENDLSCEKEVGTMRVAGITVQQCRASEPDDRWTAFLSGAQADFRFDCWFPEQNSAKCEQILSTFKFTK